MTRYVALVDGHDGAYGVTFPDLPGCTAMGDNVDEAINNAAEALRDWVEATEARGGSVPSPTAPGKFDLFSALEDLLGSHDQVAPVWTTLVPLIRNGGRPVKANLSLDSGVLAAIDAAADRMNVTRSGLVEMLARRGLPELA